MGISSTNPRVRCPGKSRSFPMRQHEPTDYIQKWSRWWTEEPATHARPLVVVAPMDVGVVPRKESLGCWCTVRRFVDVAWQGKALSSRISVLIWCLRTTSPGMRLPRSTFFVLGWRAWPTSAEGLVSRHEVVSEYRHIMVLFWGYSPSWWYLQWPLGRRHGEKWDWFLVLISDYLFDREWQEWQNLTTSKTSEFIVSPI